MSEKLKLSEKLKSSNPEEKYEILHEIMECTLGGEELFVLTRLLSDGDRNLRYLAGEILLKYDNDEILQEIIKLISSSDISIRNYSGELLVKFGEKSLNHLIKFLNNSNNSDDLKFIIDLLGIIGSNICEGEIVAILDKSKNDNVILSCIETLGNIKSEIAVGKLISLYGKNCLFDPAIIESLGKIGSPEILSFLYSIDNKVDELEKYIIIESLGRTGDEETFFFLLSELNESKGPLSWTILKSISLLKTKYNFDIPFDEKMKNLIMEAITEANEEIRDIALLMLVEFNDKESTMVCLRNYGLNENLLDLLKQKLELNSSFIITHIAEILKEEPSNIFHLLSLVNDILISKPETGKNLKNVELREIVSVLISLLNYPDEEIRILSVELLFKLDKETAALFANVFSEDSSMWNRMKLIDLLVEYNSSNAEEIIRKMMEDSEEMVSEKAREIINTNGFENLINLEFLDDAT
jgi:HEAT repeat protein